MTDRASGLGVHFPFGTSGLRVSRIAFGTTNFGTGGYHAAYGKTLDESRPILRRYLDEGGNFVDTADCYTAGESETILGTLIAEAKVRDRVVLTITAWSPLGGGFLGGS